MRDTIQNFGRALSAMVMPNIGAFIAWGLITAMFIPTGWFPNEHLAKLVGPMLTYMLPLLIGYTAGHNVAGVRGGVIGAIATAGVIVGTDVPMFIGAMIMGPLAAWVIKKFDTAVEGKIRAGFEMLVNNFSLGIIGMLLAIVGLLVLNKEAGMVVHPGHGHFSGTLVNALAHHLGISQGPDAQDERMGVLVHRIDKDTSGLLVVAKNDEAQLDLAKQFFVHSIERRYVAIVWGNLKEDEGTIIGNIGRDPNDRMRFKVFPDGDHGKHAVTHYKVLERFGYVTVVECRLETGRTHQIRVHFNWIGHPLFNDERYDGSEIRKGTIYAKYRQFIENCFKLLPRQALHAKTLGFVHPKTKQMVRLDSKLPDDMQALIDKWRKYAENMVPEE